MSTPHINELKTKIQKLSDQRDALDAQINLHKANLHLAELQFKQRKTTSLLRRAIQMMITCIAIAALIILGIVFHGYDLNPKPQNQSDITSPW